MTYGDNSLAIVLIALLGEAVLAGIPGLRQLFRAPAAMVRLAAEWFDRRLNRERRSAANRKFRGAIVVVVIAGLAAALGALIGHIAATVTDGWVIETIALALMIAGRGAFDLANRVRRALRRQSLSTARAALAREAPYDTTALDEHAVARGAIEGCARRLCDGIVAPVFWYLLLGLPGIFAYRAINATARTIGHPSPGLAAFGMTAARLDQAVNYLPVPFCGVILSLAALFVPNANPLRGLAVMVRDSRIHVSPASGWTEGAMAGALGLALAGPRHYGDALVSGPWIGDGRARATAGDIGSASYLYVVAFAIVAALVAVLALTLSGV